MSKVILITGANRGLGLGLLEKYAKKDNHVVIAAVRDPQIESARRLADIATGEGTKIVVVKIDSTVHEDAFSAVEEIQKREFDLRIYEHIETTRFNERISTQVLCWKAKC
jgi:norsolorinic acid ketoreductase